LGGRPTETLSNIPSGGKIVDDEAIIVRDEFGFYLDEPDDETPLKSGRISKKTKKAKKTKRRDNLKTQPQKKYKRQKRQCISLLKSKLDGQPHRLYTSLQQAAAYLPFMM